MVAPKESRFCVSCLRCPPPHRMRDDFKGQACTHDTHTCTKCWEEWIGDQLERLTPSHITCIECDNPLTQADFRVVATPEQYSKYLDLELRFSLSAEETFHFCPSGDCKSGQFHECGDLFECIECDYKHCLPCQRPWHPGLSCEEVQSKRKETAWKLENQFLKETEFGEETSFEEFVEVKAKPCPGCKRHIDQDGGCDHMTCSACDHEFCWVCLADYGPIYQNGNHFHKEDCEHWRKPGDDELNEAYEYPGQDEGDENGELPDLVPQNQDQAEQERIFEARRVFNAARIANARLRARVTRAVESIPEWETATGAARREWVDNAFAMERQAAAATQDRAVVEPGEHWSENAASWEGEVSFRVEPEQHRSTEPTTGWDAIGADWADWT